MAIRLENWIPGVLGNSTDQGSIGSPDSIPAGDLFTLLNENIAAGQYREAYQNSIALKDIFGGKKPGQKAPAVVTETTKDNIQFLAFLLVAGVVGYALYKG